MWIWLPGQTSPVVAGRVRAQGDHFAFTYGRSYLERDDAIPIYAPELPLRRGPIRPEPPLEIACALRDAAPKFLLSDDHALAIMRRQIAAIAHNWEAVCDEAALSIADRRLLWRRQFLNDRAFEGLEDRLAAPITREN